MSVLFQNEDCCILDHQKYTNEIYREVTSIKEYKSYRIRSDLFAIINESKSNLTVHNPRKRKKDLNTLFDEASTVKLMFARALKNISPEIIDCIQHNCSPISTSTVRAIARELFESASIDHNDMLGGNNSNQSIECEIHNNSFLLPKNSRFFCGDVTKCCEKLDGQKFDIVIADPPWWNKYIRRLKSANSMLSYSMMYNEEISLIPVKNLLANNCLIAVWCTNSLNNINAVKELIFPKWGVEYVTTWYWLKITTDLRPICEFGSACKKQPYERIIFGKVGNVKDFPDSHLAISVPSALHSHKPPLLDILQQYLETVNPRTLELFARNLLPNTTSVGYEPLKWQHISLYELVDDANTLQNDVPDD